MLDATLFYALGGVALLASGVVIGQRNPVYSAFALVVTLCSLAGIYGLLGSPFIAALQVIVYAGAIMVLFLFVLMLLNVQRESGPAPNRTLALTASVLVLLLALQVASVVTSSDRGFGPEGFSAPSVEMARSLFSAQFLYSFEAVGILILSALVGAIVLSKKDL